MADETPPGGYSMYGAAMFLAAAEDADAVAFIREMELVGAHSTAMESLMHLWDKLVQRGDTVVRAIKFGADAAMDMHPSLLFGAKPDFARHTLEVAGLVYHAVRIFPGTAANTSTGPEATARAARPPSPVSRDVGSSKRGPEHGDAFIQEMMRFAILDDCSTKCVLIAHLKDWWAEQHPNNPTADRTIERWVTRYWPPTLATK